MSKARFLSSALDGQTVTLTATQGGVTRGPNTISVWKQPVSMGGPWSGATPASLTVTVQEEIPAGAIFAPMPVEWRIRATGTSYATPDYFDVVPAPFTGITQAQEDTMRLAWEAEDPSFQRCQFVVHTGDTGNYRNDWVGSAAHRDKSKQYGQVSGHVYDTPGTYTGRSIFVYDDEGNWGTLALDDMVVGDPDTVFDAASTIVVDPDADTAVSGDWSDAPTHDAANRFNTLDAAIARFETQKDDASVPAGMRICIKAGASLTERARQMTTRDAKGVCLVDTYGGSNRFTYSERNLNTTVTPVGGDVASLFKVDTKSWAIRVANGDFDMGWDAASGRPTNITGWGDTTTLSRSFMKVPEPVNIYDANALSQDPNAKIVLHNLDIHGCGWFVYASNNNTGLRARAVATFASDCEFYDNSDYTFFTPQNLFVLGCKHWDSGNTDLGMNGRGRTMGTSRGWRGHPILIREGSAWTIYVRASYVESRGGWAGQSDNTGHLGGQPMFRLQSVAQNTVQPAGWINGRGRRYFFCDSVFSGYIDNTGDTRRGSHIVFENCFLFHDPQSGARGVMTNFAGRNSIRNCVYLVLDTSPRLSSVDYPGRDTSRFEVQGWNGRFDFFIKMRDAPFTEGSRIENRHNTFVLLRSEADIEGGDFVIRENDGVDDANYEIVEGNNVLHAPNLAPAQGPEMDTIDLPAGMRVLPPWMFMAWERKEFTLASSVVDGAFSSAILYPVDWYTDATTGADYAGSGNNNSIQIDDTALVYDNLTSPFVVGETVTNGTASAEIFADEIIDATNGRLFIGAVTGGSFAQNDTITSASGSAEVKNKSALSTVRWYQPDDAYPNASGVQQGSGNGRVDTITIIHDCNSSGVVQGDGTGTHFRIENRSGLTMPPGTYTAILDRGTTAMTPEQLMSGARLTALTSDFKLYRPTTPQALDNGLGSLLWDFGRNLRPNAGYAISPTSGTNAAGALLPEM